MPGECRSFSRVAPHRTGRAPLKAKKASGPVFAEEAARRRALKLRGGDPAAGTATANTWRGGKGGRHHRDEDGELSASDALIAREISVPETITVADLSQRMSIKAAEVIKTLMGSARW